MAYVAPTITTFVIIPLQNSAHLNDLIPTKFGKASYRLPMGEWLIAYQGTTQQLSDELGISEGPSNSAIVLSISSYWGRAPKQIWEWLQQYST